MNVLMINPPTSNLYAKLAANLPPLGLAYLAAVLREAGHRVRIVDLGVERRGLQGIDLASFDLVGISADTPRFPAAVAVAKEVKKWGRPVVMGGYHATYMDKETLETGVVDYVVRGEGEETLLNLVNALESGYHVKNVAGISYAEGNSIIRTGRTNPADNLDRLPIPARDLLPLSRYNGTLNDLPMTNLITSRGCPFNCYFCASSHFGGLKWRARSPVSIVDEIEQIQSEFGYRAFAFVDDNFTLNPKRVFEFADELERRGLDIIWWCFSRADTLAKNEPLVKRMAEAGARRVFLGLESSEQSVLKDYGKHIKVEQEKQAVALLKKYGIAVYGSFIIGAIHETRQMIQRTIRWAKYLAPQIVQFSLLTPYPGTALFQQVERENRLLHRRWQLFDGMHAVMRTDFLEPRELEKSFVQAYRKFYLGTTYLFRRKDRNPLYRNPIARVLKSIEILLILSCYV